MIGIQIIDQATDFIKKRAQAASQANAGALSSAGYRLKDLIKSGMRQQAPGDIFWPMASPWIQYGASLLARARMVQRRAERRKRGPRVPEQPLSSIKGRTPMSKLAAGARYQKTQSGDETVVRIGFLNPRLAELAAYHSVEHTVPVTGKMRRLIFAVGLGISKSTIHIPARPAVGPVYRKNEARIADFCQQRVRAAAMGQDPKGIQPSF